MAWLKPAEAPKTGMFLAKFVSAHDRERIVVLERSRTNTGTVMGTAGGLFEWDMGRMIGWHPLPEGLER